MANNIGMWVYFNAKGVCKEVINDQALRVGNSNVNKIFVYWDSDIAVSKIGVAYRDKDGEAVGTDEYLQDAYQSVKEIPYNKNRNLEYFSYEHIDEASGSLGYSVYPIEIPDEVFSTSQVIACQIRMITNDSTIYTMGLLVFSVEGETIITDSIITQSEWNYLMHKFGKITYLDYLLLDGGTMRGNIDMNENEIRNVQTLSVNTIGGIRGGSYFDYISPSKYYVNYGNSSKNLINSTIRWLKKAAKRIEKDMYYQDAIIYDIDDSQYMWLMNFDSGNDECYIDTHLGTKSSIYRALTGDKSSINVNLLGNNSAIGVSLNGNNSYIRAVLDNYSVLNIYAIGNDSNKSLDYVYLSSGYDEDDGIGANNSPLLFFKKGGTANPNKYGLYFNTETHELGYIAKENNIIEVFDLGYLKKLTTQGYKIYAHSGTSQFELDYDINATSNSIVQRDSNGQVIMNSPTTPLAGTNKQYVDELVNSKLDKKTTTGTYVYTHNGSTQDEIQYSNNYNPHTIALRDAYGGIKINTPLDAYHAVNVKYLQANYYNKSTIDSKLASIGQFKYIVSTNASTTPYGIVWYSGSTKITGSLVASSSTEYIIYLVPCKHTAAETQKGYDEYLTINNNGTYSWEVLGNTADIDLSDYVKVEDKNYFTGNITISGSGTISTVGSGDAAIVNKQYVDTAVENAIVDTGNIPEPPNTVGTYTLKATVSTSTTTKTVSDPVLVGAIPSGFNAYYHSTTLKTNLVKGTLYLQFSTNNSTWSDAGYDDGNGGWSGRSDISVNYDTGVVEVEVKASPIARTDYYLRISSYNYTETSIVKTLSWGGE